MSPGRPASVPLRHTIASSALATQHSLKWLDGVSDALAYGLRQLRDLRPLRPFGNTPAPTPPGDYPPHCFALPWRAANDDPYAATLIYDQLAQQFGEESVYFDVDSVPHGLDFRTHIQQAVEKCDVLLVVIGDKWLERDAVVQIVLPPLETPP